MPIEVVLLFAWMLVIAFLAFIACTFEDLESDTGSQSNPNSQVQLAAQVGQVNRFFNKAISGEPLSNAMYSATAGTVAWVLLQKFEPLVPDAKWKVAILAIPLGVLAAAMVHVIFATTAHCGRTAAQKRFEQPIYLDVLYGHLLPIATHGFMTTFCITSIAYIQSNIGYLAFGLENHPLNHPFALPLLCFIWGITVGSIGSSTGDIHYGTEREFQDRPFGEGKRVVYHGKITRYADCGIRTQRDIVGFCAKFGGPCTGLTFGLIILFENYRTLVGMRLGGFLSALPAITRPEEMFILAGDLAAIWGIVVGLLIGIALTAGNMVLVKWLRKRYGPFVGV
ncbi:MAG: tetrahydromethanopterin S-methyltransferase subunit E [archaeon]|nr:tetrahydromethanopterin S-methyltransferase subunit E [archaeon]